MLGLFLNRLPKLPANNITRPHSSSSSSVSSTSSAAATMPVRVEPVPRESLHVSKPVWWLESRFHFSFADYYDPKRESFGALRVINDDLVKPQAGFGAHPHRDAEIFSYIVDGELSHADSMGNREALPRGCVQYMSAGTGVRHSEMNDHPSQTCRFIQVWFTPDRRGHNPQYGSSRYEKADRHNQLLHIIGGTGARPSWPDQSPASTITLHNDANVYVSESDARKTFELSMASDRQAYLLCIEGGLKVNDQHELRMRDGMRLLGEGGPGTINPLKLTMGDQGAHFMLFEMKKEL